MVDFVLGFAMTAGEPAITTHAHKLLNQFNIGLDEIRGELQKFHDEIGDEDTTTPDENTRQSKEDAEKSSAMFQKIVVSGIIKSLS